ncbi:putative nucleotidyltransferase, ribonuclease H [Tanacetum coccineum]|uniref:RNA-directed DNA polymerase n=1 Tax=Tanacetum coccineum TaxID=301880 RepID=A0ABQ5EM77_9ASTR
MLMAFPFTLKGKARLWINRLFAGSITIWDLLKNAFLSRYRPLSQIIRQTKAIRNYGQECNEPLHLAWEGFNDLLYNCPNHKINEHEQLQIYYQGLDLETRKKADFMGLILRMTPTARIKAINELSKHSLSWYKEEEYNEKDFDKYKTPNDERGSLLEETIIILNKVPHKEKDPGGFTILCVIGQSGITKALSDLGASISLMPYSMFLRLNIRDLKPTRMCIELANKTTQFPKGIAENVMVKIDKFVFPVDFVIPDMEEDHRISIILGRPFLANAHAMIDVFNKNISFEVEDEVITFDLEKSMKFPPNEDTCHAADIINLSVVSNMKVFLPQDHVNSIEPILYHLHETHEDDDNPTLFIANSINDEKPTPKLPSHLEYDFLYNNHELSIISSLLSDQEKRSLLEVLTKHKKALSWKISDIKGISPSFCTHKILMEEKSKPTVHPQRRLNPKVQDIVKAKILKLLDVGLIYVISDSPWVSPIHVVPKKGGTTVITNKDNELVPTRTVIGWRVCIDYRKLNDATRKDHFPLPFNDQMLERLSGNEYYCFLDRFSGYFQIPLAPEDQEKTTFTCPYGTFAYRRMPFGLCNAHATFQRCMTAIFHDMCKDFMEVFMDDFFVFGNSFGTCLNNLSKMLARCEETNLVLNWEKCHFMVKEGIVLGHKISKAGIEVDKAKVDVIASLPYPTNIKGIRSFLGHAGFYRRFIKDFSKIARPMTQLLMKDAKFDFSDECIKSFDILRDKLVTAPMIIAPNWDLDFELMCDASDYAVGAVLGQRIEKKFRPIYYASKTMNSAQEHYTTTEKELLAVVYTFDKFRSYLIMSKIVVYTDHSALKYLFSKQDAKPRLIRWVLLLQEFTIKIKDKKGTENLAADHLFRLENPGKHRFLQLNQLDEFRSDAYEHSRAYKERTKCWHDSKIMDKKFQEGGGEVLVFNSRLKLFPGKLRTRWYGPYTVIKVYPYGTVEVLDRNGVQFKVNGHKNAEAKRKFSRPARPIIIGNLAEIPAVTTQPLQLRRNHYRDKELAGRRR